MKTSGRHQTLWRVFRWPVVLGSLSLTGLIGALLADGLWDCLGTGLIATTVIAVAWARRAAR